MIFVLCILIHDKTAWDLLEKEGDKEKREGGKEKREDGKKKKEGGKKEGGEKNFDITKILNAFEMMLCLDAWTKKKEYWKPQESAIEESCARKAIGGGD